MEKNDNIDYGYFIVTLEEYLIKNNITKYRLINDANLQPTQLQKYYCNKIKRLDLGVMARVCFALNCELSDIVKYIPPKNS